MNPWSLLSELVIKSVPVPRSLVLESDSTDLLRPAGIIHDACLCVLLTRQMLKLRDTGEGVFVRIINYCDWLVNLSFVGLMSKGKRLYGSLPKR